MEAIKASGIKGPFVSANGQVRVPPKKVAQVREALRMDESETQENPRSQIDGTQLSNPYYRAWAEETEGRGKNFSSWVREQHTRFSEETYESPSSLGDKYKQEFLKWMGRDAAGAKMNTMQEEPAEKRWRVASPSEVPYELAMSAHAGSSFVPEDRARSRQREYADTMQSLHDDLERRVPEDMRGDLKSEFAQFKKGYLSRYKAALQDDSRTMSSMIAGPSKFPTQRNQKRLDAAQGRWEALAQYKEKAVRAMRKNLGIDKGKAISSDAEDAVEQVEKKIADLSRAQEHMKRVNSEYRKHKGDIDKMDVSEKTKDAVRKWEEARKTQAHLGDKPFPSYAMSNNSANINRLRKRLEGLSASKGMETSEVEFPGGSIVDNVEDNRVQVVFESKPDADMRKNLKSHGFRWAPSVGAWQRKRSPDAMRWAKKIVGAQEQGQKRQPGIGAEKTPGEGALRNRFKDGDIVGRIDDKTAAEINALGFQTTASDVTIAESDIEYIERKHGAQLSEQDVDYLQKTIEEPTEVLPNIGTERSPGREDSILLVRKNGKNYISIVEVSPGEGNNKLWNFWKMDPKKGEKYLLKFRDEKTRRQQSGGATNDPSYSSLPGAPSVGQPEGLPGRQTSDAGSYEKNLTTPAEEGKPSAEDSPKFSKRPAGVETRKVVSSQPENAKENADESRREPRAEGSETDEADAGAEGSGRRETPVHVGQADAGTERDMLPESERSRLDETLSAEIRERQLGRLKEYADELAERHALVGGSIDFDGVATAINQALERGDISSEDVVVLTKEIRNREQKDIADWEAYLDQEDAAAREIQLDALMNHPVVQAVYGRLDGASLKTDYPQGYRELVRLWGLSLFHQNKKPKGMSKQEWAREVASGKRGRSRGVPLDVLASETGLDADDVFEALKDLGRQRQALVGQKGVLLDKLSEDSPKFSRRVAERTVHDLERPVEVVEVRAGVEGAERPAHYYSKGEGRKALVNAVVGEYNIESDNSTVQVSKRNVEHGINTAVREPHKASFQAHIAALKNIGSLLKKAAPAVTYPDAKKESGVQSITRYVSAMRFRNEDYAVLFTVKNYGGDRRIDLEFVRKVYDARVPKKMPISEEMGGSMSRVQAPVTKGLGKMEGAPATPASLGSTYTVKRLISGVKDGDGNVLIPEAGESEGTLFNRKSQAPAPSGVPASEVRTVLSRIKAKNALPVEVVQRQDDLPQHILDANEEGGGGIVDGVYDPRTGKIYIVADNLTRPGQATTAWLTNAVRAWRHEQGHHGIRGFFKDTFGPRWESQFRAFLSYVREAYRDTDAYKAMEKLYPGEGLFTVAEEYFMHHVVEKVAYGRKLDQQEQNLWRRFVRFVKRLLGHVTHDETYTDNEMERVAMGIFGWLEGGERAQAATQAMFSRWRNNQGSETRALDYGQRVNQASAKWADVVDAAINKKLHPRSILQMGTTPDSLVEIGLPDLPMVMDKSTLDKVTGVRSKRGSIHNLSVDQVKMLYRELAQPLAVLRYGGTSSSYTIVTKLRENGKPIIVGFDTDIQEGNIRVNLVSSAYGKDGFGKWLRGKAAAGELVYLHKKETAALLKDMSGPQLAGVLQARRASGNKLLTEGDVVNPIFDISDGPRFRRSPEEARLDAEHPSRNPLGYIKRILDLANTPTKSGDSMKDFFIRRLQDKFIRLKRLQDYFKTTKYGGKLPEAVDAYLAEELMHGRIGYDLEQFEHDTVKPLVKKLSAMGVRPEERFPLTVYDTDMRLRHP